MVASRWRIHAGGAAVTMRVLLDLRPLRPPLSGVARYCLNLTNALARSGGLEVHGLVQGDDGSLERLASKVVEERRFEPWVPRVAQNLVLDLLPTARRAWRISDFDLIHETYSARLAPCGRPPLVATIHDVIPIDAPEFYSSRIAWSVRRNLGRQVADAAAVICVSAYTRDRVLALTGCDPDKVHVVGCGVDEEEASQPDAWPAGVALHPEDDFCLVLGNVEDRKNLGLVLRAWPFVRRRHPRLKLVVAGGVNFRTRLTAQVESPPEGVVFLGSVTDAEKWTLLRRARMLLFPSLFEGFGIPALEAYYARCSVLMSRRSALAELIFDERQGFDPLSTDDFMKRWLDALDAPTWLEDATAEAHRWAQTRTWSAVASDVKAIYSKVCSHG